jgi:hypothetical protein
MSVAGVKDLINDLNAPWQRHLNDTIVWGQRFRRQMVWGDRGEMISGTAKWTETAEPLPRPLPAEFLNSAAMLTISSHPDLFKVSTPINIDRFETLLTLGEHPNPSFVRSVCQGLREGFWCYSTLSPYLFSLSLPPLYYIMIAYCRRC